MRCYICSVVGDDDYEHTMMCVEDEGFVRARYEILYRPPPVEKWPEDMTFIAKGEQPEDVPFSLWLLFSERLKEAVEAEGLTGVTFYPVRIRSQLAVPVPRYWYAHLVWIPGAIDMERSTYWWMTNPELMKRNQGKPILVMIKYVLKREAIAGWDLFRTAESPGAEFCSERFRALFREIGGTGLGFCNVPLT